VPFESEAGRANAVLKIKNSANAHIVVEIMAIRRSRVPC